MTINTRDQLINAMANNSSRLIIDKASIASQAAGSFVSLWRATGQPGQGAIPSASAACTNATLGALQFTQQTAPATSYLGILEGFAANAGSTIEIHDRLAHMGGLVGNVATMQTANLDMLSLLGSNNMDARIGDANYSDIQWWMEWYTPTGTTAVTATVAVTYDDGTTGYITVSLAASRPASVMIPLNGLIPAGVVGKFIRAINSVMLSATTGTAGSFGFTATRYRASLYTPVSNARFTADWAGVGLPNIANSACLFPVVLTPTTSSGIIRATGKIVHG